MFFLVFSMLLVGVAAGASDAAAGDTGVNRLVQVAVSAGAALLGGAQRRARMSVDPKQAANTVDYCDTRAYAGKGALWEDLANAGKAKRATQIVDQLKGYAADDAAFDGMISRIIYNPRLAGCSTAQAQRKHGQAELKDEICQRVKAALQQLKQSKVASSGDGYKVFHRIRSSLHCVTN